MPNLVCSAIKSCSSLSHGVRNVPEALTVFKVLQVKGVTHIVEVIVPDCPIHPHKNKDIIESLCSFHVRILDWKKRDLSVELLRRASPEVEELHLYSSGNQGILDQWASDEGLCRLEKVYFTTLKL